MCIVLGSLTASHAMISPARWSDASGIRYEVETDGSFRIAWSDYPFDMPPTDAYQKMSRSLRRYLSVEGFRQRVHIGMTVNIQTREGPGDANADVRSRFALVVRLDFTDWQDGINAVTSIPWLEDAMGAYSEAFAGLPYPLARLFWAYEILEGAAGNQAKLRNRIRWPRKRLSHLTQSLQVHRHPGCIPILTEAECFDEVRALITDYAESEGHRI